MTGPSEDAKGPPLKIGANDAGRQISFADLAAGQAVERELIIDPEMIAGFSALTSDYAKIHHDGAFARSIGFDAPVVHGMLTTAPFSMIIGMHLPGEGYLIRSQAFEFRKPVFAGDELTYRVEVVRVRESLRVVELALSVIHESGTLITGRCDCVPAARTGAAH